MFRPIDIQKIVAVALLFAIMIAGALLAKAQGGADYGRGAETDPVASALSTAVSGRVAVVEGRTNAWNTGATVAASATNRLAVMEGRTNTWEGAAINAGNWTNHAAAMVAASTNTIITADAKTNTIIVERGSIKSWSVTE